MKIDPSDFSECSFQMGETINFTTSSASPTYSLDSTIMQQTNCILPPIYCIGIESIKHSKGMLCFLQPIIAIVGYSDNLYCMENKDLGIITMSIDYKQCLQDFKDEFLFILKAYGEEKDNNLTTDAKELKKRILRYLIK